MFKSKKIIILILILVASTVTITSVFAKEKLIVSDIVDINNSIPTDYQFKSNKYTQIEDNFDQVQNDFIPDITNFNFQYNEHLNIGIAYSKIDLSFVIHDRNSDYYWTSKIDTSYLDDEDSPLHDEGDLSLNIPAERRAKSPFSISYYVNDIKSEETLFDNNASKFTVKDLTGNKIGFEADIALAISEISFKFLVYLDNTGLNIEVPFESIDDSKEGKLSNLIMYKFFGATKYDRIHGYTFIPDGIGALIRYTSERTGLYNKRFFGNDLSLTQSYQMEEELYANMYGVIHGVNQYGFVSIIEAGSAYGNLVYESTRVSDDFHKTYISFEYRMIYTQYLNASKTDSVKLVQAEKNKFNIKLNYKFISGEEANYLGMASAFREYLDLETVKDLTNDINLHLTILGAEYKQTLFGKKSFSLTTIEQLEEIIKRLNEKNVNNMDITYLGWSNIGYSDSSYKFKSLNKKLGNKKELKDFLEIYKDNIFFNVDYNKASISGGGYSSKNISQSIDQSLISNYRGDSYLVNPLSSLEQLNKDYIKINKLGITNLNFDSLSDSLYGSFKKGSNNREDVIDILTSHLEVSSKTSVRKPFSYLWFSDIIYDIPLYSSNQSRFSDTVPFIPLVLSGKTVYGRSSNFFSNTSNELLRMVDYNIFPSFYLTYESSNLLLDTKSNNIYTSRFEDWEEEIVRQYNYVNNALNKTLNSYIVNREILDTGLTKNTYNNGVIIYINYSGNTYNINNILINPTSYEVVL